MGILAIRLRRPNVPLCHTSRLPADPWLSLQNSKDLCVESVPPSCCPPLPMCPTHCHMFHPGKGIRLGLYCSEQLLKVPTLAPAPCSGPPTLFKP